MPAAIISNLVTSIPYLSHLFSFTSRGWTVIVVNELLNIQLVDDAAPHLSIEHVLITIIKGLKKSSDISHCVHSLSRYVFPLRLLQQLVGQHASYFKFNIKFYKM